MAKMTTDTMIMIAILVLVVGIFFVLLASSGSAIDKGAGRAVGIFSLFGGR